MKTPNEVHKKSNRAYSGRVEDWAYPASMKMKMITVNGGMRWHHADFTMVSSALFGKYVGLEAVEDGVWIVYYRSVALGVFSERTNRVYEREDYRL